MLRSAIALLILLTAIPASAQWQLHDAHTTADLRGIDNVGGGVAWASGSDGTILRTEDAGFVWQLCAKPPNGEHLDFRAIQAFDNNTAIIMSIGKGDQSRLYKTTDGCQTWKLLFTNPDKDGFWDALAFSQQRPAVSDEIWRNRRYGVLIGDPVSGIFSIWETHDSGSHWARFNADDPRHSAKADPNESLFAASNEALMVPGNHADFAFVTGRARTRFCSANLHSPFDGARWYAVDCQRIPIPTGPSSGAFAIAATPSGEAVYQDFLIVGGDYAQPTKGTTSVFFSGRPRPVLGYRSGQTSTTPPHGFRSAVAYDSKSKTWITVGPNGTDVSTDDGRNWRALHPDPAFNDTPDADQHWNALSLPYVVGPHGRIGTLRPSALQPK